MHAQLFGMVDQRVLMRVIHDKDFRKYVCKYIDTIVTTEVPEAVVGSHNFLILYLLPHNLMLLLTMYIQRDSAFCRLRLNSHQHSFTCWKGECLNISDVLPKTICKKDLPYGYCTCS